MLKFKKKKLKAKTNLRVSSIFLSKANAYSTTNRNRMVGTKLFHRLKRNVMNLQSLVNSSSKTLNFHSSGLIKFIELRYVHLLVKLSVLFNL